MLRLCTCFKRGLHALLIFVEKELALLLLGDEVLEQGLVHVHVLVPVAHAALARVAAGALQLLLCVILHLVSSCKVRRPCVEE